MINNSIQLIEAYRHGGLWVFDDEEHSLVKEAFVPTASAIINGALRDKHGHSNWEKARLLFSHSPFPDAHVAKSIAMDDGGSWYNASIGEVKMVGWLCPATLFYFSDYPETIYFTAEGLE